MIFKVLQHPMSRIAGQSGCLALNDSCVKFGKWSIDENLPNRPGQNYWSGSFRIQDSDHEKVFALFTSDQNIKAEFHENNLKHSGKIMIIKFPIPSTIVHFTGTGELNKSSRPQ